MLELKDLLCGYANHVLVQAPNTVLAKGEVLFLLGRNGSGKSTLLKTIAGVTKALQGNVYYKTQLVHEGSSIKNRPIFMPAQNQFYQGLTGDDLLRLYEVENSSWKCDQIFAAFEILPLLKRQLIELSSGERQRIMLAATLSHQSEVVLLDEPFSFLDWKYCQQAIQLINRQIEQKRCFVISTHDFNWGLKCRHNQAWLLIDRQIRTYQDLKAALTSSAMQALFEVNTCIVTNPLDQSPMLATSQKQEEHS